MNLGIILKVAGIGLIVTVISQILGKSGRDEQVVYVTIAGIITVLIIIIGELGDLFDLIKSVFGL